MELDAGRFISYVVGLGCGVAATIFVQWLIYVIRQNLTRLFYKVARQVMRELLANSE